MTPDKGLDRKDEPDEPLENQPLEWADEDRVIEDRKPDLGEIEEDTSELWASASPVNLAHNNDTDTLRSFLGQQVLDWGINHFGSGQLNTRDVKMQGGHINLSFTTAAVDSFTTDAGLPSITAALQSAFPNQIFGHRQDVGAETLHSDLSNGTFNFISIFTILRTVLWASANTSSSTYWREPSPALVWIRLSTDD